MAAIPDNPRILLLRLGRFGDLVFTLPAVHLVRATFPRAHLAFLVYSEYAPLLEGFPGLDAVLTLNRSGFRQLNPASMVKEISSLLRHLAARRYDLVVDLHGNGETGLVTWLSRAPQRWGLVYRPGRRWAYTHPVPRDPHAHPVEYLLTVLRQAGGLVPNPIRNQFVLPTPMLEEARRAFRQLGLDPARPTLFLQPFTSTPAKDWPFPQHLALARRWRQRGLQVLFGGGPGDLAALAPARDAGFSVAAGTPLLVSAGLVYLSTVVLGSDTGLMHLAVALGKRVVVLMGSSQKGACYPFGHREWAVLPPDRGPMSALDLEVVDRASAQAFAEMGLSEA